MDLKKLSDAELFSTFKTYAKQARINTRKSAGFLPELARRGLHRKRGCGSIHELAAKHAMLSRESVDKVLRLDRQFENAPQMRALLENGEVGWSKLAVVAGCVTETTDGLWADKVKKMTKRGLETYVKELKIQETKTACEKIDHPLKKVWNANSPGGMFNLEELVEIVKPLEFESEPTWNTFSFKVSPENEIKWRKIKHQLEKTRGAVMTFNEVMGALLEGAVGEEASIKLEICPDCVSHRANEHAQKRAVSRHLPTEVIRVIIARSGGCCEFPNCRRPGEIFHHTRRFALKRNHDPQFLVYLCEAHERVAQSNLIKNEEKPPATWSLRQTAPWWDLKTVIDEKVSTYRSE